MRLLVITQKVDKNDSILGFFHNWLLKFAENFDNIIVICLEKGQYDLPQNIQILSLGKENKASRWQYVSKFYQYIWQDRKNYDAVFVHMNQEYVLLGGIFWRIFAKKIILWRNHKIGNFLTSVAVYFANKVYCTSVESFTAKFQKTKVMPVGIDTDMFNRKENIEKIPKSILFLSRVSSIKNPGTLLEALVILKKRNINFYAEFIGDALAKDLNFYQQLKTQTTKYDLGDRVKWLPAVPNWQTPKIYNKFLVSINLTASGSLDKTMFEAMACETLVLSSNTALENIVPAEFFCEYQNSEQLANKLEYILTLSSDDQKKYAKKFRQYVVENHSLYKLIFSLTNSLK